MFHGGFNKYSFDYIYQMIFGWQFQSKLKHPNKLRFQLNVVAE
ncbi:uncharacterized protein METZ01_LOCUS345522 [marine metagenome]|uniref:Uncharacterized protein n=1 Tax=marine metagenome TaxID=408172 RepID=A0A382R6L5_9ZZZZ